MPRPPVPDTPQANPAAEPRGEMERDGLASPGPVIVPDGMRATGPQSPADGGSPPSAVPDQLSGGLRVLEDERDEVLAEQASRSDERAFEVLVDRYQRVIFNLTLRISGNREDARELTQDVFVKIWRGLRGFDPKRRFFSWIYRIAIHESLNLRRRSGRQEALEGEPESKETGPEQRFEALEMESRIHEALDELSDGDRQLLILRHFLDHTYEEIAEVLGVPAGKVKSRLYTARQRLRGALEKGARP